MSVEVDIRLATKKDHFWYENCEGDKFVFMYRQPKGMWQDLCVEDLPQILCGEPNQAWRAEEEE